MTPVADVLEPIKCSVCEKEFTPADILEFVCRNCQEKLIGHCDCGYDDVSMDWGINIEDDKPPYYWIISCVCGNEMQSADHFVNDIDTTAKELHARWCGAHS